MAATNAHGGRRAAKVAGQLRDAERVLGISGIGSNRRSMVQVMVVVHQVRMSRMRLHVLRL